MLEFCMVLYMYCRWTFFPHVGELDQLADRSLRTSNMWDESARGTGIEARILHFVSPLLFLSFSLSSLFLSPSLFSLSLSVSLPSLSSLFLSPSPQPRQLHIHTDGSTWSPCIKYAAHIVMSHVYHLSISCDLARRARTLHDHMHASSLQPSC